MDEKEIEQMKKDLAAANERAKALEEENKKLKAPPPEDDDEEEGGDDEKDLRKKAENERNERDKRAAETKRVESAVKFNLNIPEFAKSNSELLPSKITDIIKSSEGQTFDSQVDKANSLRAAIVGEFFAVQANLDLLTESQKAKVEEFQGLSVKGREQRAEQIYFDIFEPVLESARKLKKVQDLNKSRDGQTKGDDAYKNKLLSMARKQYLGEKETA